MAEKPVQDYQQRLLRFVSDAVHDLVGPVDQVSSLVALFVRRYGKPLDDEAQNLLTHIESAAARLSATASGLRSYFSVAETGNRTTRVNSRTALESALLSLQRMIQDSQAEIIIGELPAVQADPNLLTTLFQTLIQNSLKFRRAGISQHVLVSAACSETTCRFSIADNGIGIDPQYTQEVFIAFRKLNGHAYPGAGMGLTVARAIVEALEGKIWITGAETQGTTVFFELPAASEPLADIG
jgi:light-regulated signal transduction histidine kinase (bacteriophytochrome)